MKKWQRADNSAADPLQTNNEQEISNVASSAESYARRYMWWNFFVISFDCALWMVGQACMDVGAVLPVFTNTLTASTLIIGLLTMLPGLGWTLPQLIGVAGILHRPRKKGFLLGLAAIGRTPMVLIPILLFSPWRHNKPLILWTMVACFVFLYLSDGMLSTAWYDIIGKTIPSHLRGRFFATMSFLGAVGAFGSGFIVKHVLADANLVYPHQYGILFTCLCAGLFISLILLFLIREPEGVVMAEEAQSVRKVLSMIPPLWRNCPPLRKVLSVSWIISMSGLAWPFYILHGMKVLRLPADAGALFIWAGTFGNIIASPVWAWLNDRKGPRSVIIGVSVTKLGSPALALLVPWIISMTPSLAEPHMAQYAYATVFFFGGALMTGVMMGISNYLIELSSPEERPLFVGMGNTLTAPGLLAPLLGGWIASFWCYEGVFAIALGIGIVAAIASLGLVEPKKDHHPAPMIPPEISRTTG